jgi:hypothetical protein
MVGVARIELATPAMSTLDRGPKTAGKQRDFFAARLAKVTPKTLTFCSVYTAQSQRHRNLFLKISKASCRKSP